IVREGFGAFWGFLKAWTEMLVSGPGSVAGVAIIFGEFFTEFMGSHSQWPPPTWGVAAVLVFTAINLMGIRWGGMIQVIITLIKIAALLVLVFGSLLLAEATPVTETVSQAEGAHELWGFIRLVGLGIGAVLFTYDGWVDISHVAGEVKHPKKILPLGLIVGVGAIALLYLLVNWAFLRIVPLQAMREEPTLIAATVARATFGEAGAKLITGLIMVSIFGALGGLVMTLPRLYFAIGVQYAKQTRKGHPLNWFFRVLSGVSARTAAPVGAILFVAVLSCIALLFFRTFSRVVNFFVVSNYFFNILLIGAVFKLRRRSANEEAYRAPGYPVVPLIFMVVIAGFLISALVYRPEDTFIGVVLTALGIPFYFWIRNRGE
ncbi:MAG: APC family permease, partial [bacterium]